MTDPESTVGTQTKPLHVRSPQSVDTSDRRREGPLRKELVSAALEAPSHRPMTRERRLTCRVLAGANSIVLSLPIRRRTSDRKRLFGLRRFGPPVHRRGRRRREKPGSPRRCLHSCQAATHPHTHIGIYYSVLLEEC